MTTATHDVHWHTLQPSDILESLKTDAQNGLSDSEAAARLQTYGPNILQASGHTPAWKLLLQQFQNLLIVILLIGTVLSGVLGHETEAIAIGVIVLLAVMLGFIQEYRAEKAMEALQKMAAPTANVIRGGVEVEIPSADVVPGDVILLAAGDRVPADGRLLEAANLTIEEAVLTGESVAVEKDARALVTEKAPLGERKNVVFSGTVVTYGRGRAVATGTGMQSEFGKIAGLLQTVKSGPTPLQQNLDKVGRVLAIAALVVVVLIVGVGLARGQDWLEMLIFGIALAVAVVPEALPAVVTISLAIGVQRLVKRNALIRRLPAVETLGSTTVICTDKTGTLTKDEMTIRNVVIGNELLDVSGSGYAPEGKVTKDGKELQAPRALQELAIAGTLCSDASLHRAEGQWDIKGDPTEGAIVVLAKKLGFEKTELEHENPRVDEIPFTSETKRMTTFHAVQGSTVAYVKGAAEMIVADCSSMVAPDGTEQPLTDTQRKQLLTTAQELAGKALRVLAVAKKTSATRENALHDLTLLGLVGMIDPPRSEAAAAIKVCKRAGIKVTMITGDHPVTAQAIARELGLLEQDLVVTGPELESMSDAKLESIVESVDVFARVSPAHKLRIVTALQKRGHVAAMTGDGVNDAPALKKADIGIAMGITGTDVTKEAAAMTLTDDNFASIVSAVEEGRGIYGNIRKYLMYLLSSNIGEICLMATTSILGMPAPLSAVQILYVNLATDGLPALALAVDKASPNIMLQPPRNTRTGIFTKPVILQLLTGGIWSAFANFCLFVYALRSGRSLEEAMSMSFVCLVLTEFCKAYLFRTDGWIFRGTWSNRWLNLSILVEICMLMVILYVPFMHGPLGTFALTLTDWIIVACVAVTIIPIVESAKWISRRMQHVHWTGG